MVKLEDLTEKEIENRENKRKSEEMRKQFSQTYSRFFETTREMFDTPSFLGFFGQRNVEQFDSDFSECKITLNIRPDPNNRGKSMYSIFGFKQIDFGTYRAWVHDPSKNKINVYYQDHLNPALRLAHAYEKAGFGEFTVKKGYEE